MASRDRIIWPGRERLLEQLSRLLQPVLTLINARQVRTNPRAPAPRGDCPLVKGLRVQPICAANGTAHPERGGEDDSARRRDPKSSWWQFDHPSEKDEKQPGQREIKPMLGGGSIQVEQIGNRQESTNEPDHSKSSQTLSGASLQRACDQRCSSEQTGKGEEIEREMIFPGPRRAKDAWINHAPLHV